MRGESSRKVIISSFLLMKELELESSVRVSSQPPRPQQGMGEYGRAMGVASTVQRRTRVGGAWFWFGDVSLEIVFVEENKCGWGVLEVSCGGEEGDGEDCIGAMCYIWSIGSAACIT
jgi:hypothetical protein